MSTNAGDWVGVEKERIDWEPCKGGDAVVWMDKLLTDDCDNAKFIIIMITIMITIIIIIMNILLYQNVDLQSKHMMQTPCHYCTIYNSVSRGTSKLYLRIMAVECLRLHYYNCCMITNLHKNSHNKYNNTFLEHCHITMSYSCLTEQ